MNEALTPIPPWADTELSKALPDVAAKGEGQAVEFKRDIPRQARDLGKGVAAFSTSGAGRLFIGVSETGEVVGLPSMDASADRDKFLRRVQGIVRENVKPQPKWRIAWAVSGGKVVAVLVVDRGPEPVYYYDSRPYLRDGASSRPALPEEVARLIGGQSGRASEEAIAHDRRIFERADALMSEKQLLGLLDVLQTHHMHNDSQTTRVVHFAMFFREAGNQYLTGALQERSGQLVERLTELIKFIGINHFLYPEGQTGPDPRYCLQPELTWNRSRDGPTSEELERHEVLVSEQDKVCESVREAYREYRSGVKRSLFQ